jgi:hypothetical protein
MIELSAIHVLLLEESIARGMTLEMAFSTSVGNTVAASGLWRFFSDTFPPQGIHWWNESSVWKEHWKPFLPNGLICFGEDVFGNQLVIVHGEENIFLWNHEDGVLVDLLLVPTELLSTVAESGIDWIDFYAKGSLDIARKYGRIPENSHLHWTTPLVLGGAVRLENLEVVERERHLVGHAKLWLQIVGIEPGSNIHVKRPNE